VVESADPTDLQLLAGAAISSLPAGYIVTNITLAGAGDGHMFTVTIDAGLAADVTGGFVSPPTVECFLGSDASALARARVLASPLSGVFADTQIAGASKGQRVMGLVVKGTLAGGGGSAGAPFSGLWYVDPLTSATTRDGSDEAPFKTINEAIAARAAAGDIIVQLALVGRFNSYSGEAVVMPPTIGVLALSSLASYGNFPTLDSVAVGKQDGTVLPQTLNLAGVLVGEVFVGPACHIQVSKGGIFQITPHLPLQLGSTIVVTGDIPQNLSRGTGEFDAAVAVPDYANATLQVANAQVFAPSGNVLQFSASTSFLGGGAVIATGTKLELDDCFVQDGSALSVVTDHMRLWNTEFEQGAAGATTLTGGAGVPQLQVDGDTNWQIKNAPVTVSGFSAKVIQTDIAQLARLNGSLAGPLSPGPSFLNLAVVQNNIGALVAPSEFRIDVDGVYLITVAGQALAPSNCRIKSQPAGFNGTIGGCDTTAADGGLGGVATFSVDATAPADDRTIQISGQSAAPGANWNGVVVVITRLGPRS
jgi:hypothetical protein